jgi:hypothetical protein
MKHLWGYGLGCAWLAAVLFGMWQLNTYESITGVQAAAKRAWPAETALPLDPGVPTLVFFGHPHCPCTRASLTELSEMAAKLNNHVSIVTVFAVPENTPSAWAETDLTAGARRLPNAQMVLDRGNVEILRFGCKTSGSVMLYSPAGALLYSGGLTGSRGHEGDNAARAAAEASILTGKAAGPVMPVFGCSLL